MKSSIVVGRISHHRTKSQISDFKFNHSMFLINLSELETNKTLPWLIRNNKFSLFTVSDTNYIDKRKISITKKIRSIINIPQQAFESYSWYLLTSPRLVGYTFNPASFYFGIDSNNNLKICLVEVNNTFAESHIYVLDKFIKYNNRYLQSSHSKEFHVSPFINREGIYKFKFRLHPNNINVQIVLSQSNSKIMEAAFTGYINDLTNKNILRFFSNLIFSSWFTEIRILIQASKLYFISKLRLYRKPTRKPGTNDSPNSGFISKLKFPF